MKSLEIAGTDYPLLDLTNRFISVNGEMLDLASHVSNGNFVLPVSNPYWIDSLRNDISDVRPNISIRSLASETFLSNTSEMYCKHRYTVFFANVSKPFYLKVNACLPLSSVTIDGKPAVFEKVGKCVPPKYYRIELPSGTAANRNTVMDITTAGLPPLTKDDVPAIYQNYTSNPAFVYAFPSFEAVPLPPVVDTAFSYKLVYHIFNDNLSRIDGYIWSLHKDIYFGSNKPLNRENISQLTTVIL